MKKQYIEPNIEVVEIEVHQLLAGSKPDLGGEYGGGEILAPEFNIDED